ncbi:MAG: DUF427 domain-containing protein [Pseudomonadota bacterium]
MAKVPDWLSRARSGWTHRGQRRPDFALPTGEGQESVWDYPRPPRLAPDEREVVVRAEGRTLAQTRRASRMLETASPPTFYLPPDDVSTAHLRRGAGESFCEWKGAATYWDLIDDEGNVLAHKVAWSYARPLEPFAVLADWFCFYPSAVECYVDGERVRPQSSAFYGGWITDEVIGPFKGDPGTQGW